eukprot:gi/632951301/ref/XP_007891213.1/ PREDICTED: HBS1-like protein isoform X2 [Callorhinchus milii]
MSRHRNVRGLKYDEDLEDDDVYGHSVDDDYCISPATAAQFIYKRDDYNVRAFIEEPLEEGEEEEEPSHNNHPTLPGVDQARLHSCLDRMREVLGESVSEQVMVDAVLSSQFDTQQALDLLLSQEGKQTSKIKNKDAAPLWNPPIGDIFYSSQPSAFKPIGSCLSSDLLDDTDKSSTFDLSSLLSTKSELSLLSAPMTMSGSTKTENTIGGEGTSAENMSGGLSLSELIKETSNIQPVNNPLAAQANANLLGGISLADLIRDHEGSNSQNVKSTVLPFGGLSELCSETTIGFEQSIVSATEKSELSQNHMDEVLQPSCIILSKQTNMPTSNLPSQNPDRLASSLGTLTLVDQLKEHQHKSSGLADDLGSIPQSSPTDMLGRNNLFLQCGSPSLADLIEEHNKNNPCPCDSFSVPEWGQRIHSPDSAILPLESLSLAQLASDHQTKMGTHPLMGSLSSLITSEPLNTYALGNVSLFDLITESDSQMPENSAAKDVIFNVAEIRHCSGNIVGLQSANLNILTQTQTSEPEVELSNALVQKIVAQNTKVKNSKASQGSTSIGRKFSKRTRTTSWTKRCCAKPSWFALALCFQNPKNTRNGALFSIHKAFVYNRQVPEITQESQCPLYEIKPFNFNTPSPDDIIKASQKKAFTRD